MNIFNIDLIIDYNWLLLVCLQFNKNENLSLLLIYTAIKFSVGNRSVCCTTSSCQSGETARGIQYGNDAEVSNESRSSNKYSNARHSSSTYGNYDATRHSRIHRGLSDETTAYRHATRYVRKFQKC